MAKAFPTDVVSQAQTTLTAWQQITPPLTTIGPLTPAILAAEMAEVQPLINQINALETQLIDVRNQRDALYTSIWGKVKRVRSGIKGIYGDDSSEYEMIGGTRLSERKRPSRTSTSGD